MKHGSLLRYLYLFCRALFPILLLLLLGSVYWSGYFYQYNGDELLHTQISYLILHGSLPFRDFFSIYTPLFHWFLLPIITLVGTSLATLHALRIVMIIIFTIGIVCTVISIRLLFSREISWVFLALILLDPFTTFAGMQIRPDTLMLTIFSVALLFSLIARKKGGVVWVFSSGLLLSSSALIAIKIAPAVLPILLAMLYILPNKSRWVFLLGGVLPWVLFVGYFVLRGVGIPMLTQLTIDIKYLSDAILYPTRFGFFYIPNNVYIYGLMGKPLTWYFVYILPVLAFCGGVVMLLRPHTLIQRAFFISMILTFLALFIPTTAFIQYYLPSYWFFAIFSAIFLVFLFKKLPQSFKSIAVLGILPIYLLFWSTALRGNIGRSAIGWQDTEARLTKYWEKIPQNEAVFPGFLFRPAVHPLINGYFMGDMPQIVRKQFELPETSLEQTKTPYVFLNDPALWTYESSTQEYIVTHYSKMNGDEELRKRIQ